MTTPSETTEITASAVQMEATVGDVDANLDHAEELARRALDEGADVVALPEFFTTQVILDERVWDAVLPQDNAAVEMLTELATAYDATVGGSMLVEDDGDVYNRYVLAKGDGTVATHDKDIPTMWENAFYIGGDDDGVVETDHGTAGVAVCWELIRYQTLDQLAGRIQYTITGNHWWMIPENWPGARQLFGATAQYNRYLSEYAPQEFAERLGVPTLHASHCGTFDGRYLLYPGDERGVPYTSRFVGATQIVDANGDVLASRRTDEGPGIVTATIDVPAESPTDVPTITDPEDGFWVPNLTLGHKFYWHHQNACAAKYYEANYHRHLPARDVDRGA